MSFEKRHVVTLPLLLAILLIAGAGIAYFAALLGRPLIGDDLIYAGSYPANYDGIKGLPLFMARNWLHVNARMGDMLSPVWLSLIPQWVLALMCGSAVAGMLYATASLACKKTLRNNDVIAFSIVALMLLLLPWWDSTMLFVVQFNYIWASAAALLILLLILRRKMQNRLWILLAPLSFLAGSMHEAMGFPLACGIITYICASPIATSHIDNMSKKCNIAALILGGFFSITSPASYSRLVQASVTTPDDPMWLLYLKSDFLVLALIAWVIILGLAHRRRLRQLLRSTWVIFVVAAVVSSVFSAVSGIVGRSGWFAQIFALIAFARTIELDKTNTKSRILTNVVIFMVTVALLSQLYAMAYIQRQCNHELEEVLESYKASTDGVVYFDVTPDSKKPVCLMHKTMSVPDADDIWLNHTIDRMYGSDKKKLRVLPTAISDFEVLPEEKGTVAHIGDSFLTSEYPAESHILPSGLIVLLQEECEYIVVPYRKQECQLYYITPRDIDPGDR